MKTSLRSPLPNDTLELHVDDDGFYIPLLKPSSDKLQPWRKVALILHTARLFSGKVERRHLRPRLRSTVHAVLAVDRFRKPLKQGNTPLLENGLVQEVGATDLDVLACVFEAPTSADPLQAEEAERVFRSLGEQESDIPRVAGDFCIELQSPPQAMEALLWRAHVMDVPFEPFSSNNINSPMLPHHFNLEHAINIPNDDIPGGNTFDATMRGVALDNHATFIIAADPALTRQSATVKAAILAAKTAFAIALLSISATILLQGGVRGSSKTRAGLILSELFTMALLVASLCSFLYILMEIFILFAVGLNTAWQDGNASHPRTIRTISVAANLCFVVSASALLTALIVEVLSKLNSRQQTN